MTAENTLNVDLDRRVSGSPRYKAHSVSEYFQESSLDWWKPTQDAYLDQSDQIRKWVHGNSFRNALEIGPGFGRITQIILPQTEKLTLIEVNEKAARQLGHKFSSARILRMPVENYEWNEKFDLIVAVEVMVHIPKIPELLDRVSAGLDNGGRFITSITPDLFYKGKRTIIHRGINIGEFEIAMNTRGLEIVEKRQKDQLLSYELVKRK